MKRTMDEANKTRTMAEIFIIIRYCRDFVGPAKNTRIRNEGRDDTMVVLDAEILYTHNWLLIYVRRDRSGFFKSVEILSAKSKAGVLLTNESVM